MISQNIDNKKQSCCKKDNKIKFESGKVSDTWQQKEESWNLIDYIEEVTITQADSRRSGTGVIRNGT